MVELKTLPPSAPESEEGPTHDLPTREEAPFISSRLMVLLAIFSLVIAIYGIRIFKLTILEGPKYFQKSEQNFLREEPLIAPRGKILDRNGLPLAINQPLFDVEISRFNMKKPQIEATLKRLARLLNRPNLCNEKIVNEISKLWPAWRSISLLDGKPITLAEVLPVLEQANELPGVVVTPQYQRCYPEGDVAGIVTGYVTAIDKNKMEDFLAKGYMRTEKVGQLGAELTFESLLHGKHGVELVERDHQGRPCARQIGSPAQPGHILKLTLDMRLQKLANALLEGWKGCIIAMDPRDGAVLAMAARPHFDPNNPTGRGAPPGTFTTYSKVTRSKFAPGSTFKMVTAAAGLLAGFKASEGINCPGGYTPPGVGKNFPCNWRPGHDWENLYGALQQSCNVYFYKWAQRAGAERMIETSAAFGFGQRTDFELTTPVEESTGKLAQLGVHKIFTGKLLHMGIGQGEYIDVTPMQLAHAYAAMANGGVMVRPRIIKEITTADGQPVPNYTDYQGRTVQVGKPDVQGHLPLNEAQRQEILKGLWMVCNEHGGTAFRPDRFHHPEWRVAGKTGTAQTGRIDPKTGKQETPNAWFVCFAPIEKPEILILVLVENSGHGGDIAAPLARQMLAMYKGTPEPVQPPPLKGSKKPEATTD